MNIPNHPSSVILNNKFNTVLEETKNNPEQSQSPKPKPPENIQLKFRLIETTSEDIDHPLNSLLHGPKGEGWQSSRYCQFPQEIYLQFFQPVNLKQINILIHEKNIPSQIKFFIYNPRNSDEIVKNFKHLPFMYAGFIKMDTNVRSNYQAREFRKIYIDFNCWYIKLELYKNYMNRHNIFNQIGLISVDFFGHYLGFIGKSIKQNQFYLTEGVKPQNVTDNELEGICGDQWNEWKSKMEEYIKEEKYDQCKVIKSKLEKVRLFGKKLYDLEYQKRIAVNNEDFDTAKDLKELSDKMKSAWNNIDKHDTIANDTTIINNSFDEQVVGVHNNNNNNNGNIPIDMINESINTNNWDNTHSNINNKMNNSWGYISNNYHQSTAKKIQELNEQDFLAYDDIIIPTVLNKIHNKERVKPEETGEADRGELEEIDPKYINIYAPIVKHIGEEGWRKILSKQILWKEEGLELFLSKMSDMFSSQTSSDGINTMITLIMKLVMLFLEEKHPSTVLKTWDIVKQLLDSIKEHRTQLNIDLNITDTMLTKIKLKWGDVMPKVRNKTVELYCYMLTLDFCDYNNWISELIEEEWKHVDSKYIQKSSKLILGKMEIFNSVFDYFQNAVASKRTDMDSFPYSLVSNYLILNVTNSKSEIRKMTRWVIMKFIKIFGTKKIIKKLEKVPERELSKLVNEVPELQSLFPSLMNNNGGNNSSWDMSNNSNNSNDKKKNANNINNKSRGGNRSKSKQKQNANKKKEVIRCTYCQKEMPSKEALPEHWATDCVIFTKCEKCDLNMEVRKWTNHWLSECSFKNDFEKCKRCKEAIDRAVYDKHVKENKCNPAKNPNSSNRCPLCHKDIPRMIKDFTRTSWRKVARRSSGRTSKCDEEVIRDHDAPARAMRWRVCSRWCGAG